MKTKTINKKDYSAKKCKEMQGRDGYVISFDLHYKGKKCAEVFDDGNGGMVSIIWHDNAMTKGTGSCKNWRQAENDFMALVKQMGEYEFMGEMSEYNDEVLVMEIYEDQRLEKQLKRKLKGKVLFINEDGNCQEIAWKGTKEINPLHWRIAKKHYPEIKTTLNELPFNEALETFLVATR